MTTPRTVVVAGAGIGGLAAALALAGKGYRVVVLEKAARLEPTGAGIQLTPNATRVLLSLGLGDALRSRATVVDGVSIATARAGGDVVVLPLGERATLASGAPYLAVLRADLQAVLFEAADAHTDIDLRLGWQFEDCEPHQRGISVIARQDLARETHLGLAVIGADGIWSAVRRKLYPDLLPRFTGLVAWRGTFSARDLPRVITRKRVQLFMGANAHLVAYPVAAGSKINLVAIVRGDWNRPGWNEPGETVELTRVFARENWPSQARLMIGAVESFTRYALYTLPELPVAAAGGVALLGDAAHPMLPFAAQGAGMAIEDAAVLADSVGPHREQSPTDMAKALAQYAGRRRARIQRIMRTAETNGRVFHMQGVRAFARDMTMRALGGKRLLARQDWIYDWQV